MLHLPGDSAEREAGFQRAAFHTPAIPRRGSSTLPCICGPAQFASGKTNPAPLPEGTTVAPRALERAAELYLEGGIRWVEIGTLMFGQHAAMDLVRLAIPRCVYTQSHLDYVVEVILEVWKRREQIRCLKLSNKAPFLRHFTGRLQAI